MRHTRWWTALVAAIALPAVSSCDNAFTALGPVPGRLVVSLETERAPAGAILLLLQGEGISAPTALDGGSRLFVRPLDDAGTYRVAVVGERMSGPLFVFDVPDVTHPAAYSVRLLEVADVANGLQTDVAGYRLFVHGRGRTGTAGATTLQ
ncbi:MAG: hypothetical protein ACREME_12940 [Gemmatimonadales bacterium]